MQQYVLSCVDLVYSVVYHRLPNHSLKESVEIVMRLPYFPPLSQTFFLIFWHLELFLGPSLVLSGHFSIQGSHYPFFSFSPQVG